MGGQSPHEQALNLAEMMYVGSARDRGLGDRSAGDAAARVAHRRPVAQPAAAPSEPERTPAPGNAIAGADRPQSQAAPPQPAPVRRASPLRLVEPDTTDAGACLADEELLWGEGVAASSPDVVAAAAISEPPVGQSGLPLGQQRRRWSDAAKPSAATATAAATAAAAAPTAPVAPDVRGVEELDADELLEDGAQAPADAPAPVVADATEPSEIFDRPSWPRPGRSLRAAASISSRHASRQRQRLRRPAVAGSSTRRRALVRGVVAGVLVAAIAVVAAVAFGGGLKSAGPGPAARSAAAPAPASHVSTVKSADRVGEQAVDARQAAAAKARREAAAKAKRERREARERAERRTRERRQAAASTAARASTPAPAGSPAASATAPAPVAPAPPTTSSSSSSNRAGWTGEFTP